MNESEIRRMVLYLNEVWCAHQDYRKLWGRGAIKITIPPAFENLKKAITLPKEIKEAANKWKAEEKAKKKRAKDVVHAHLLLLHGKVYRLQDAIEDTEDVAKKARLQKLVEAAVGWINLIERELQVRYDSLRQDNTPYESSNRKLCHPRKWHEECTAIDQIHEVIFCSEKDLADLPCKDYGQYEDKELAWVVNESHRILVQLEHWAKEKMTKKVFHYYVYGKNPCKERLKTIAKKMDNLITHWQYYNQGLSKNISRNYKDLQRAAKKTDKHYKRLSILPYWNERDFNPMQVKQCAAELHNKLLHIASMAYGDLEKAEKPEETELKAETEKYIRLAEQIACKLEDWANPKTKTGLRYEYVGHLRPISIALEGFDKLLDWLHSNKAELGKVVQAGYDKLVSKAKLDGHLLETLYDGDEVFSEQCAIDLADTLRVVVAMLENVVVGEPEVIGQVRHPYLSITDLIKHFQISDSQKGAFRKKIERCRINQTYGDGFFREIANPRVNEPKYCLLYTSPSPRD